MSDFRAFLLGKWDAAAATAGVLRSSPSEAQCRALDGSLQLLVQYNPTHVAKKRPVDPQLLRTGANPPIATTTAAASAFNFTKISHDEVLCELRFPGDDTEDNEGIGQLQFDAPASETLPQHAVLINVSPLRLGRKLLQYSIEIVDAMHEPHFAVGFNSSGAWSSVNHFHLQGFFTDELHGLPSGSPKRFPILNQQRSERFRFGNVVVYDFPFWPIHCYAAGIDASTTQQKSVDPRERETLVNAVWCFVELLQARNVAHNVLIGHDEPDFPLVIVFPRQLQRESSIGPVEQGGYVTTTTASSSGCLRFAIAELAGLVIAGDEKTLNELTQDQYARILETEVSLSEPASTCKGFITCAWCAYCVCVMGSGLSVFSSSHDDPNVLSLKHFEIHRVVGKDGFGKVNAVIRKKTRPPQWFAVKALSKIVVVEKNCDAYNCYMVMDLLLGGDLKFHLTGTYKTGFNELHARFYVAGTLLSLQYLHTKAILHRDVKLENIVLDDKGYPRLTDLGVSVQADNLRYRGNSGTTPYMAPELFLGNHHEHGIAADFFSLGILAHELLFGKKSWTGNVQAQLENMGVKDLMDFPEDWCIHYCTSDMLDLTSSNSSVNSK
ncbi:Ciliate-e2/ciliate-e2-unclassified protein kinase, partial [Globisporangium splendens]